MKIILDSYAWIELFRGTEAGLAVRRLIAASEAAYTPDIVLAEVARKYRREGSEVQVIRDRLLGIEQTSTTTSIDHEIALAGAEAYLELRQVAKRKRQDDPSLANALVLATARAYEAKLVTGDAHLKDLREVTWIGA